MYYCAHAIFYFKVEQQESFLIYENIYLIEAGDEDAAMVKAQTIARDNEDLNEDGHLELNEKPAQMLFAGIRKIVAVADYSGSAEPALSCGVELTYSIMEVDTESEVEMLAKGDSVNILYRE